MNINMVAESNDYSKKTVEQVDAQSRKALELFKDYYENATEEEKGTLNEKFKTYVNEELQKDEELKNKLNGSEIKESSEITEQDIANLKTVENLTEVLNNYPNISSPEYRAIKKMVDEHVRDLSRTTQEVLAGNQEGNKLDEKAD